ncbi:hypothetical protein [Cryobacterium sp. Y62]|uniref:hypothetical protein n=1 Tax=Cryobacterium sp. Y62 TaxID=2048284 RepID=UPI0011B0860F|nr:hypothetical protein [Cryobacterium sp. Y62]
MGALTVSATILRTVLTAHVPEVTGLNVELVYSRARRAGHAGPGTPGRARRAGHAGPGSCRSILKPGQVPPRGRRLGR